MNIFNRLNNAVAAFTKTENNVGVDPNAFLRHGSRRMSPKWTAPEIDDKDFYTGYGFAVINKRANRSVVLGKKFLYTDAKDEVIAEANEKGERLEHPYLKLIRSSTDFSERDFWYNISTYLDLEGVYYLMAVRSVGRNRVGNVQKFVMLNPYNVRPVVDSKGELGGYVERRGDKQREIPKEMIIPIRLLNPFDPDKAYSLADAARDSQFTLKQANDFAREAIDGNLNAPGILSSAIELPDDQFDNFVARIRNGRSENGGEPIFGNGAGTVNWIDMQTDLDKAALDKINSINRDTLLAISGLSKTGVGVEESGTGREVSRTQKDDFTENAIMPQIENIIDALNLDYRKNNSQAWAANNFNIALDNPLETNKDAEQADVDIRDSQFALMKTMLSAGYTYDISAKYAKGLIDITDLGEIPEKKEDTNEDQGPNEPTNDPTEDDPQIEENSVESLEQFEGYPIPVIQYLEDQAEFITASTEKSSIINSTKDQKVVYIQQIEDSAGKIIAKTDTGFIELGEFKPNADRVAILAKLNKRYKKQPVALKKKLELTQNALSQQDSLDALLASSKAAEERLYNWYVDALVSGTISPHADLEAFIEALSMPFAVWFTIMYPIYSAERSVQTAKELDIDSSLFVATLTDDIRQQINEFAKKEATSHMNTIKSDLETAIANIRATTSDLSEIKSLLAEEFEKIQKRRASLIAENASARIKAFSYYEADTQLLAEADLIENAYKVLESSTGDPCSVCAEIIHNTNNSPIPFKQDFVGLGETIETEDLKMHFNYEAISAGNVHVGCMCFYKIVLDEQN